ncbi:MAG: hypothetical protein UHM52_08130, partial [Acutalibacteraceae bacterium]|nr:hypothetical protein [Acutalibacteraceae bacterium]
QVGVFFQYRKPNAEDGARKRALRKQSCGLFLAKGAAAAARCGFAKQKRVESHTQKSLYTPFEKW